MVEQNKIYNRDCLEGMKEMLAQGLQVDCVLTDPPYNISTEGKELKRDKPNVKTSRKTSIKFDFGEWDRKDDAEFKTFTTEFIELAVKLLKPGGAFLCWFAKEKISWLADVCEANGIKTKTIIVWHKSNPIPQFRLVNYISATEFCYYGVKNGGSLTFNFEKQNEMHNFVEYPNASIYGQTNHPTEKPLHIIYKFLRIHTNEGDLVLDPFSGSGTTAVACHQMQRRYICFENKEIYFDESTNRLNKVRSQLSLFDLKE